MFKNLGFTSPG